MNQRPLKELFLGGQSLGVYNHANTAPSIGTLTFIDPALYSYGAIGHYLPVCSSRSMKNWSIRASTIESIQKSKTALSGSKRGTIISSGLSGSIKKNTNHGIFGNIRGFEANPFFKEPIPIGSLEELYTGAATVYTVIQNEKVDEFEVMIESILMKRARTQYLGIKVVDQKLIHKAGGIVKGMSGSPIVQNGKIIGALSHLSASDNLCGYAIFIGNMINDLRWKECSFSIQSIRKFFAIPLSLNGS